MIAASQPSPFQFYVGVASLARSLARPLTPAQNWQNERSPRRPERRRRPQRRGGAAIEVVGFTGGGRGRGGASGQAARTLTLHMPVRSPYTPYLPTSYVCVYAQPTQSEQLQVLCIQHEHHIFSPSCPELRLCLPTSCARVSATDCSK